MIIIIVIIAALLLSVVWWKYVIPDSAKSDPMLFAERRCKCDCVPKNWQCGPR